MAKQKIPEGAKLVASNKRAGFEYSFLQEFEAGIQLRGTEIKSIRQGYTNLTDAYCYFHNSELYVQKMYIKEYSHGTYNNHEPMQRRKLLLRRAELRKLEKRVKEKGFSIVPLNVYINERGFAKMGIALAQGKKVYDKRESIKERDVQRQMDRVKHA